jgi:hypothetical protein
LSTCGNFGLSSLRWEGWSCSWLVLLLQAHGSQAGVGGPVGGAWVVAASAAKSWKGSHSQHQRWPAQSCTTWNVSCPTPTPPTHLKSEVGRSKVILPSGLGYSRGEKSAAGRSRSWSPYLRSSSNRGRQEAAP